MSDVKMIAKDPAMVTMQAGIVANTAGLGRVETKVDKHVDDCGVDSVRRARWEGGVDGSLKFIVRILWTMLGLMSTTITVASVIIFQGKGG